MHFILSSGSLVFVDKKPDSGDFVSACWNGSELTVEVSFRGARKVFNNPTSLGLMEWLGEDLTSRVVMELNLHGFTADRLAVV